MIERIARINLKFLDKYGTTLLEFDLIRLDIRKRQNNFFYAESLDANNLRLVHLKYFFL